MPAIGDYTTFSMMGEIAFGLGLNLKQVSQAVQLLWPREEDFTHDFYRPAGAAHLRAVLDSHGQPRALLIHSAGDAITPRWAQRNAPLLAWSARAAASSCTTTSY